MHGGKVTFNKQKYLDKSIKKITEEIESLESLKNEGEDIKQIIEQCLDWYEQDNLALYSVFRESCGSPGCFEFFGALRSFLVNVLLDDSCFKITWKKMNLETNKYESGIPWKDTPQIDWAYDLDENSSTNPKEILKIFEYYKGKDLERQKKNDELLDLFKKLRGES